MSPPPGSVAVVTGGARGLGVEICRQRAQAGLEVWLTARTLQRADRVLVNSVCPGWTATDMGGGGRPVPEGARSVTWACLLPDDGPTGGFFRDGRALDW